MRLLQDLRLSVHLALRSGWGWYCFWSLLGLTVVTILAGLFSARQPATVALDVGLSFIRIVIPLVVIILTQELVCREFDRRYYLTSLTYPRPRVEFLLGRYGAIALLSLGLLMVMAGPLFLLVKFVASEYQQATPVALGRPFLLTFGFLCAEIFVVSAFALLLAVTTPSTGFVLIGALGFVLIARSYASAIALLSFNEDLVSKIVSPDTYITTLSLLRYILPDLGALDIRIVTLYGDMAMFPDDWIWRLGSVACYSVILLTAAVATLNRKRFG